MALAEHRVYSILAMNENAFDNSVVASTAWSCMGMDHSTGYAQFSALPLKVEVAFSMDGFNWDSLNNIAPDPSGVNFYTWNLKIGSSKFIRVTFQAPAAPGNTAHFNSELHTDED